MGQNSLNNYNYQILFYGLSYNYNKKKLCFIIFPRLHVKFYIVTKPLLKVFFFNRGTDLINGTCFFIRQGVGTGKELD